MNKNLLKELENAIKKVDDEYFSDDFNYELNYIPERVGEIMQDKFGDSLWIEAWWEEDFDDHSLGLESVIETITQKCMNSTIESYAITRDNTHDIIYVAYLTTKKD